MSRGQTIGFVGTSGNARRDTPHLALRHFQARTDRRWWEGEPIDPFDVWKPDASLRATDDLGDADAGGGADALGVAAEVVGRHRHAVEEALAEIAAERAELLGLLPVLDALGHRLERHRLAEADDRPDERRRRWRRSSGARRTTDRS